MLQRAASNAYSWWWASHIRTKQSKWLEENLQDMEEKVSQMLKIIDNEGDSFAQRIEMYYKKRPELINHVEESYRSYRALAERFNHLSMDLQSANRTIATIFPEQVQYAMDDDDECEHDEQDLTTSTPPDDPTEGFDVLKVPNVPTKEFSSHSMSLSKKGQLNIIASSAKAAAPPSSGLSQEEALEEINRLQKEILALQTEKEFVQSVCQRCQEKCWKIENQITGMQAKISGLQDEFKIHSVIDDNEARTLMAATALKSCQETLVNLEEKQEESAEEAKVEDKRIKEVHQKLMALKSELLSEQTDMQKPTDEKEDETENHHMEMLREKIKNELNANSKSHFTVMQLAERIDELVEKVAALETTVSSQSALVNRLTSETDGLQAQVKTLEEEKETLIENSEDKENKLKETEEELQRVRNLNQSVKDQNKDLQTRLTEAICNLDHLSEKLKTVKPDEEFVKQKESAKTDGDVEEHEEKPATGSDAFVLKAMEMEKEENKADVPLSHSATPEKLPALKRNKRHERKCLSETDVNLDTELEEAGTDEEADQPDWRQLFLSDSDDREKLLLEEYTLVLKNYKDVRKKMSDVEKKNRDGFFELALQIRELKHALAHRDEEIQFLRKMNPGQQYQDDDHGSNSSKFKYSRESMTQAGFLDSSFSTLSSPRQDVFCTGSEQHCESGRIGDVGSHRGIRKYPTKEVRNEMKLKCTDAPQAVSAIEEKFRSDIDELLEENLEFWLRFSISFHQIRKFQTSIHDLKVELSKLKDRKWQSDGSGKTPSRVSEARPIYKHLREIYTDLSLWLENSSVLKDEQHGRYASLCNIQEELSRVAHVSFKAGEPELSENQAAKFQGEVLNMKQESNKVADELRVGVDRVRRLRVEVEDILAKMDEELGISASKHRNPSHKARIPLRSFLFGVKLKKHKSQQKPSIFSCASPALQKQSSDVATAGKLPQ